MRRRVGRVLVFDDYPVVDGVHAAAGDREFVPALQLDPGLLLKEGEQFLVSMRISSSLLAVAATALIRSANSAAFLVISRRATRAAGLGHSPHDCESLPFQGLLAWTALYQTKTSARRQGFG